MLLAVAAEYAAAPYKVLHKLVSQLKTLTKPVFKCFCLPKCLKYLIDRYVFYIRQYIYYYYYVIHQYFLLLQLQVATSYRPVRPSVNLLTLSRHKFHQFSEPK